MPSVLDNLWPSLHSSDESQTYDGEIVDDYITGVEQVGAEPTVAVETAHAVDNQDKVDPATDDYKFMEYEIKENDNTYHKEVVKKLYDYEEYEDYGPTDAMPTSAVYEEEFGPGVPAETDFKESNVSGMDELKMVVLRTGLKVRDQGSGDGSRCLCLCFIFSTLSLETNKQKRRDVDLYDRTDTQPVTSWPPWTLLFIKGMPFWVVTPSLDLVDYFKKSHWMQF